MIDFINVLDDELGLDDPYDLARPFIDYARKRYDDPGSLPEPVPPIITRERRVADGSCCFVITKNRASSWAEDLAEMVSVEERTRVFN